VDIFSKLSFFPDGLLNAMNFWRTAMPFPEFRAAKYDLDANKNEVSYDLDCASVGS
jgi:hypothetical protein